MKVSGEAFRESRYHRQTLLPWWDQDQVGDARFLIVGAGALGNEILKTLALMGAGNLLVYDMDRIERSNLSRAVLFRESDEGRPKAEAAADAVRDLNPEVRVRARVDNIAHRGGLGVFAWADVVLGGVDNREARVFLSSACARTGRLLVDGAIEGLSGVVRVFDPANGPCYECTMNATDRKLLAERRSCALLARDVAALGRVPTTAVSASIVGALQAQQALKILHGQEHLSGGGLHWNGSTDEAHRVGYPRREGCPGHDRLGDPEPLGLGVGDATLGELLDRAEAEVGAGAVLDLSRDVVLALTCPDCEEGEAPGAALGEVGEAEAACPRCGTHRIVEVAGSISPDDDRIDPSLTPRDLGLAPYDVIVARRGVDVRRPWLFDADAEEVLGDLAPGEAAADG